MLWGSQTSFDGDIIAFNSGKGVLELSDDSLINQVDFGEVSIDSNGDLGIDLGDDGVTENDSGDADTGPNARQNFPVISAAAINGPQTTVSGDLNSISSTSYRIDIYASAACDPSGNGEGEERITSFNVSTDPSGNAPFSEERRPPARRRRGRSPPQPPASRPAEYPSSATASPPRPPVRAGATRSTAWSTRATAPATPAAPCATPFSPPTASPPTRQSPSPWPAPSACRAARCLH